MRTEQQLMEAFESLAAEANSPDLVLSHVQVGPKPSTTRQRRVLLVLAAALVVVLAITIPNVFANRTVAPADTRSAGNWDLIHRVDLPTGWAVNLTSVAETVESTQVTTPAGRPNPTSSCYVTVWGRGAYTPSTPAAQRQPVDVNGHAGFYAAPSESRSTLGGVVWAYVDGGWANVDCGSTKAAALEMARRVTFEPTPVVLPFRLRSLPEGYHVAVVQSGQVEGSPVPSTEVRLASNVKNETRPGVSLAVYPGTAEVRPGLPGCEQTTIQGLPAILNASDGTLCLNDQGRQICLEASGGAPADLSVSLWPAGRRELLVGVANSLKLAKHLDSTRGWTDANEALNPWSGLVELMSAGPTAGSQTVPQIRDLWHT